jgi:prepilin-type N-terminal cleavage/methylation domain-containing protein
MLRRQRHLPTSSCPRSGPSGQTGPAAPRSGFTLVEMMVAVMIMAVGLLGMVSTSAYVARQVGGGTHQTVAANVIQSRMEWMRSLPCSSFSTETNVITRGVREMWRPGATANKVLAVHYTARYAVSGSQKKRDYTVMIPCW